MTPDEIAALCLGCPARMGEGCCSVDCNLRGHIARQADEIERLRGALERYVKAKAGWDATKGSVDHFHPSGHADAVWQEYLDAEKALRMLSHPAEQALGGES